MEVLEVLVHGLGASHGGSRSSLCRGGGRTRSAAGPPKHVHQTPEESSSTLLLLLPLLRAHRGLGELPGESRVLAHHLLHARHIRVSEHALGHMEHDCAASDAEEEPELGCHIGLASILHVQLLKDIVVVVDLLVHLVGPSFEFHRKRVIIVVEELDPRDACHESVSPPSDADVDLSIEGQPRKLGLHLVERVSHGEVPGQTDALFLDAVQLIQHVPLGPDGLFWGEMSTIQSLDGAGDRRFALILIVVIVIVIVILIVIVIVIVILLLPPPEEERGGRCGHGHGHGLLGVGWGFRLRRREGPTTTLPAGDGR